MSCGVPPPVRTTRCWISRSASGVETGGSDAGQALLYARVSSKEKEKAGFSVPAQLKLPKEMRQGRASRPSVEGRSGTDVKYVVVVRNPEEAIVSLYPFIGAHSEAWFDLWQVPRQALVKPDFATFFAEVANPGFVSMIFEFVAHWWPYRHAANVLFLHYSDMKRDHEGSVRRIAEFLGFAPSPAQWPAVLEYTSFRWMKTHQEKFEVQTLGEVPILTKGAMIRKGAVGAAAEDGMTDTIAAAIRATGRALVTDPAALAWTYAGGRVPD
jgi:hypothetical protein